MSKISSSLRKLSGEPNTTASIRERVYTWYYSFKGSIALADSSRVYPHLADSVLVCQIKTIAAVHEDSGEMVSVNYWFEHQGN